MNKLSLLVFSLCLTCKLFAQAPNFVFVLADDMGWTGSSVLMDPNEDGSVSDFYETPVLEMLAGQGMTFSNAYAPAPKCSPTRCSILTGQSTARNQFTETGNDAPTDELLIPPATNQVIPSDDTTIAEWLQALGLSYRTAHYGKWHLGGGGPADHGFDDGDGNTSNNDGNALDGESIQNDPKKINALTDKGIAFMKSAVEDQVPFYLQISHYAVHTLVESTQGSYNFFSAKIPGNIHDNIEYAGMTKDLDEALGRLLEEIENLGITSQTYVIFMSDNGAQVNQSSNLPLRRGKTLLYEGGIRVPLIIRGPGVLAGTYCSESVIGYDLFPTIAALTGSRAPLPEDLDGADISPLFSGGRLTRSSPLFFHSPHYGNPAKQPRSTVVSDRYKYIAEYHSGVDYLYDLENDIEENNNIAAENPEMTRTLKVALRDHLRDVAANMPSINPDHPNFLGMAPDVDQDGLEDAWEISELLTYVYGPDDDPDGDGLINSEEFDAASDPLTPDSETVSVQLRYDPDLVADIFPNPNDGLFLVEFKSRREYTRQVEILNLWGQSILQKTLLPGAATTLINVGDHPSGIYLLKASDGIRQNIQRLILQKK